MLDVAVESRVRDAFNAQRAQRWQVAATSAKERLKKLGRLREAIMKRRPAIEAALHADFRKCPEEVEITELFPVLTEIDMCRRHLADWMLPQPVQTPLVLGMASSEIRYE